MYICLGDIVDVEHGEGFIRAAQEHTSHFHSLAFIRLMGFLLPSNLTFQKKVMGSSATHLWLASLKHHKSFGGWSAGWEPGLAQLCRNKGAQLVFAAFMWKRLIMTAICSKAVRNTKMMNLLQWHVWVPRGICVQLVRMMQTLPDSVSAPYLWFTYFCLFEGAEWKMPACYSEP